MIKRPSGKRQAENLRDTFLGDVTMKQITLPLGGAAASEAAMDAAVADSFRSSDGCHGGGRSRDRNAGLHG